MKLTKSQINALMILAGRHWISSPESDGTYMPYADDHRTFASLARKGLATAETAGSNGYTYSGYVITDAGRAALAAS